MSQQGNRLSICTVADKTGTVGQRIEVFTNMARLKAAEPNKMVYVYAVYFDNPDEPEMLRRRMLESVKDQLGGFYTYNGVYVYLPEKKEKSIYHIRVGHPIQEGQTVGIRIMYRTKATVTQCNGLLKALLGSMLDEMGYKRFYRLHYDPSSVRQLRHSDVEIYGAYRLRLAAAEVPLAVFVDLVHVFRRTQTVSDVFQSCGGGDVSRRKMLEDYCVGRPVTNYEDNQLFSVIDISLREGMISPILWVLRRILRKDPEGGLSWISEFKSVDPRRYSVTVTRSGHQPSFAEKACITKHTRVSPALRVSRIQRWLHSLSSHAGCQHILRNWNLRLLPQLISIEARVLPRPLISFGDGTAEGKKLFWNPRTEAPTRKFLKTVPFKTWRVFCTNADKNLADKLILSFSYEADRFGMTVSRGKRVIVQTEDHPHCTSAFYAKILEEITTDVQFFIVILPSLAGFEMKDIYCRLKKLCMTDIGIVSQMVNARTLKTKSQDARQWDLLVGSLISNVNCKLGGILWSVKLPLSEKTMLVGLDVWHGDLRRKFSIGAVVFTLNSDMSRVHSVVKRHAFKEEIFGDIEEEIEIALRRFTAENSGLPQRIIIYRDGVHRPWYGKVLEQELSQFHKAIDRVYEGWKPLLSLVIVQKRIYERFFVRNNKGCVVNPPPGTVVDHTMTRRKCYDFFLCSMHRVKGTAVPTHYVMLYDDSGMSPDEFQGMTQALCYSYCNWPGSFYVPSVVQYAHKLAGSVGKCGGTFPASGLCQQLHFL